MPTIVERGLAAAYDLARSVATPKDPRVAPAREKWRIEVNQRHFRRILYDKTGQRPRIVPLNHGEPRIAFAEPAEPTGLGRGRVTLSRPT